MPQQRIERVVDSLQGLENGACVSSVLRVDFLQFRSENAYGCSMLAQLGRLYRCIDGDKLDRNLDLRQFFCALRHTL
jgi:hypothetical protein